MKDKKKEWKNRQKTEEEKKYSMLSNIVYFHKYLYGEYPKLAAYHVISVVSRCIAPLLGILMPGIVLSMAEGGNLLRGLVVIALAGLGMMICDVAREGVDNKIYFWENLFRTVMISDVVLKLLRCHYKHVEYGEQKKVTRRVYQSMESGNLCYKMLDQPRNLLVNMICFLLYSTVLGTLKLWMVAVVILLSLANYGILQLRNRWQLAFRDQFAQSNREINFTQHSFRDAGIAKDIRIFSINDWLAAFQKKVFAKRMRMEKQKNRKILLADCLQSLLSILRNGLSYGYLIYACLRGDIAVSAFLVYFGAIAGFSDFITGIVDTYSDLKLANKDACCLRMHMDLPEIDEGKGEIPAALYAQPAKIEFRDVSFSYGEQKMYDHFNLTIQPGEKVALLGVNGAGKSTLVKLLCGLYEPDSGAIFINDVDISTVSKRVLYDLFSVVFQEATILPFPVGCNLSMQRLQRTDEARTWKALGQAGLEELFRKRGIKMDSYMTSAAFPEGVELSGGETQRFLLARALYKDGHILILDEPTAAMDPIAESEIYQKYVEFSKGRTCLFISHRLASTKFSDRILYMENCRIVEEGTHETLMALGGSYAHMFKVQSHYYAAKHQQNTVLE